MRAALVVLALVACGGPDRDTLARISCTAFQEPDAAATCLGELLTATSGDGVLVVKDSRPSRSYVVPFGSFIGSPQPENTELRLASLTKPVLAALAMEMVDSGELALDAKVAEFFPELKPEELRGMTVLDLIQHRSGLQSGSTTPAPRNPDDWRSLLTFASEPDVVRIYSNSNYTILGEVLQRVGSKPLDALVRARIPALGEQFQIDAWSAARPRALGRVDGLDGRHTATAVFSGLMYREEFGAAGGGVSTAGAIAEFVVRLFADRVVTDHLLDHRDMGGVLGWLRHSGADGRAVVWHNGALTPWGWQSLAVWVPERQYAIVVLSDTDQTTYDLTETVMPVLVGEKPLEGERHLFSKAFVTIVAWHVVGLTYFGALIFWAFSRRREDSASSTYNSLLFSFFAFALLAESAAIHAALAVATFSLVASMKLAGPKLARVISLLVLASTLVIRAVLSLR
jgi:CubicO group peptidase (beta-lactamase class C family)